MTDAYTPTTEEVRVAYAWAIGTAKELPRDVHDLILAESALAFDRWLATVTAPRTQPSVEDVARALHADDLARGRAHAAFEDMDDYAREWYFDEARAVLALWPGRTEQEVKAEALRAFIAEADASPAVTWNGNGGVKQLALARADRIEGGEQ